MEHWNGCYCDAISDSPCCCCDIHQVDWKDCCRPLAEQIGKQYTEGWYEGGRAAGYHAEFCSRANTAKKQLRNELAVHTSQRLLPEVIARLDVIGDENGVLLKFRPKLAGKSDFYDGLLRFQLHGFDVCETPSPRHPGSRAAPLPPQKWFVLERQWSDSLSSRCAP